jgi:putative FmdB family regulatory protein
MPIYEYRCEACGHELEALQKLSDPVLTICSACGEPRLKKAISAPNFRLKGSGWYETDFKKEGDKKRNLADSGTAANDSGEASPKKESGAQPAKTDSAGQNSGKSDSSSDTSGKKGKTSASTNKTPSNSKPAA